MPTTERKSKKTNRKKKNGPMNTLPQLCQSGFKTKGLSLLIFLILFLKLPSRFSLVAVSRTKLSAHVNFNFTNFNRKN